LDINKLQVELKLLLSLGLLPAKWQRGLRTQPIVFLNVAILIVVSGKGTGLILDNILILAVVNFRNNDNCVELFFYYIDTKIYLGV